MSYVCAQLDEVGQCAEWAQAFAFSSLTVQEAGEISAVIIGCWAVAFGLRLVANFIINRL